MALDPVIYAQTIEEYQDKVDKCIVSYGNKLRTLIQGSLKISKDIQRKLFYLLTIRSLIDNLSTQECLTDAQFDIISEELHNICPSCDLNLRIKTQVQIMADCVEFEEEWNDLTTGNTVDLTYYPCTGTKVRVYRNGVRQDYFDEYSISGKTVTFVVAFSISGGSGSAGENVFIEYETNYTQ